MKKIIRRLLLALMAGVAVSCMRTKPSEGLYEGILQEENGTRAYVMLALQGDRYEMLRKKNEQREARLFRGEISSFSGGKLRLDNDVEFDLLHDSLSYRGAGLKRLSGSGEIPKLYTVQYLKNNETGEDAEVCLYEEGGKGHAVFRFRGGETKLDESGRTEGEGLVYGDEGYRLETVSTPHSTALFGNVLLKDGPDTYTFMPLTPSCATYLLTTKSGAPACLNVIYFHDGTHAEVKLIATDGSWFCTLPQSDASAKTADYSDGNVQWSTGNHGNAELTLHGKPFPYLQTER